MKYLHVLFVFCNLFECFNVWIVCIQALCKCFCLLRVWKTWGRPPPPKTMSSVRSCSAFSTKAWTSEACTAGMLRTATRSFRFCARGVWVNFLFVIKNVSVICSAGAMCLFWYSLCHRANVRGYKRQCRKRGLLLHPQGRRPVSQLHVSWRRAWDVRRRAVWAATRLPALPQGSQRVLQVHLPRSRYYHRIRTHPTGYKPPVCNDHQWLEAFQCS